MRFGKWRGVPLAMALAVVLGLGLAGLARADGWRLHPTLAREVPAYDFTTGGEYMAPPIPYGHYAKDYAGGVAKHVGMARGLFGGLLHHGGGCGDGCGHGHGCSDGGCGHGHGGDPAGSCGFCSGLSLFHHGNKGCGDGTGDFGSPGGHGSKHRKHFAPCHDPVVMATSQVQPTGQAGVAPSAQSPCGVQGCGLGGKHSHLSKLLCRLCGGKGCGGCGGLGMGDPCNQCGGNGCGGCGGCGLFHHGKGGTGCHKCGGHGCPSCLQGLGSKAHGMLGHLTGSMRGLLGHNKVDYFVGPGGPVPLTPGYVPYIVTTRSPREFFSFAPMNPDAP
jgi:hypothetical protein